jgi:hypothetical protein
VELAVNVIAKSMYAMCDTEDNQYLLLDGIVNHRKDESAAAKADMYVQHGSNRHFRKTTRGSFVWNGRTAAHHGNG